MNEISMTKVYETITEHASWYLPSIDNKEIVKFLKYSENVPRCSIIPTPRSDKDTIVISISVILLLGTLRKELLQ